MGPKTFLDALFRGGKRFPVTGYAHHPLCDAARGHADRHRPRRDDGAVDLGPAAVPCQQMLLTGVQLQFRPQGSTAWTNTGPPIGVTDPLGFFSGQVSITFAGVVRAVWTSTTEYPFALSSREAVVSF